MLQNLAKGTLAILTWLALFTFVQWYNTRQGYWLYWLIIAPALGLVFIVATAIKPTLRDEIRNRLTWLFDIYDEKMEWVAFFILASICGGVIYFILFAPYGILCHLSLRVCGK